MPVRIYAYAKERKVDSKDVVDLCLKLGIKNKGSALAPLEEEEVAKLNLYLDGESGTSRPDILVAPPLEVRSASTKASILNKSTCPTDPGVCPVYPRVTVCPNLRFSQAT